MTGRFYTWAAAFDSAALANDTENPQTCGYHVTCDRLTSTALAEAPIQGICPSGWHLPCNAEWKALFTAVGGSSTAGTALKSQTGWYSYSGVPAGTDAYGFSALPAGSRNGGSFLDDGFYADFWSASEYGCLLYAYGVYLSYGYRYAFLSYGNKHGGYSVRCLQDN